MSDPLVIFIVYLLYGLAFFSMGIAVVSRDTRSSNLSLAPRLWLFAVFAFTHAFHEWSELYLILQGNQLDPQLLLRIKGLKLWPVLASFLFLLLFGIFLLGRVYPRLHNHNGWAAPRRNWRGETLPFWCPVRHNPRSPRPGSRSA